MSTNRLPTVEKLLSRIQVAERSQQKEIRLTIQEARELTTELALFSTELAAGIKEMKSVLQDIKEATSNITVKFDGGNF
jgi:hypothetical protein